MQINKNVAIGLGLIALGAVLTLLSHQGNGGGTIFYGLIVVGIYRIVRGATEAL